MKTRAQESVILYLNQLGYSSTDMRCEDRDVVSVWAPEGKRRFTVNLYEDILEILPDGTKRIVAESDVSHKGFGGVSRATKWTAKG